LLQPASGKTIFRLIPVPAGKNPERLQPEARDIFRLPGINPPDRPGRVFAEAGAPATLPAACHGAGPGCGGWADPEPD